MTFSIPQVVRHKESGDLLITRERRQDGVYLCACIDNRYVLRAYAPDALEVAPAHKPGGFDLMTELTPRIQGALPWEHAEPADLQQTLSNIASCAGWTCYPDVGYLKAPGSRAAYGAWARFFLSRTQGGEYTGEAHALMYESGKMPSAWKVAICQHEIVDSSTAQGRMRGWHPARCSKCGIDLSVDSSD